MNKSPKKAISILLIAIMAFISTGLPFFESSKIDKQADSEIKSTFQNSSLDLADGLAYLLDADKNDFNTIRIDVKNTLFYYFSSFTIQWKHDGEVSKILALSRLVSVNLTISTLIFPFAYFW
ncbi:hypothetical protein P872_05050 [Rhodonellum psychrophilum GCM71 = DSM 17998]|uniref:Uncharacterized protein n=2 Tax=Rhodonellum TaxID=336827 RepID=U5BYR2_9BACT|nr:MULTISPECIES: hypothetical protein [Rhodonellum]ERM82983.1 hypothetical protein P872_05050 [Rhodonellum psychrophilum GCM71 = DSM 17998]MDO9553047.1 hypothetical protein [Rhodonellum sp.]